MVNKRKADFLRKKGKLIGTPYILEVTGNKCYSHKVIKNEKKWGNRRDF